MKLTAARLREILIYFPETGEFCLEGPSFQATCSRASRGLSLGNRLSGHRHRRLALSSHRLAWLYVHGAWPSAHIDHKNGIKNDNRIRNLRECSVAENTRNRAAGMRRLGFKGVTLDQAFRPMVRKDQRQRQGDQSRPLRVDNRGGRGLRGGGAPSPWSLCEDQWDVPVATRSKFLRIGERQARKY